MDLRRLRYFMAVAEELHFARAARRLSMTQPALSQQITRFEKEVAAPLLRRNKRHVELTEAGRVVLEQGRVLLARSAEVERAARRAAGGELGTFRLGFISSACHRILPPLLREFVGEYPNIDLRLMELTSVEQIEALRRGDADAAVGIVQHSVENDDLMITPLVTAPLVAALPADHALTSEPTLSVEALADEPFVLCPRSEGPGLFDDVVAVCHRVGFTPDILQEVDTLYGVLALVASGLGVSLVPEWATLTDTDNICYRPVVDSSARVHIGVVSVGAEPVVMNFLSAARRASQKIWWSVEDPKPDE